MILMEKRVKACVLFELALLPNYKNLELNNPGFRSS
jgi:hypothetical protein